MPVLKRIFGPMPFARLSYTHVFSTAADAFFAVSLAGSLFFNVSIGAARPRVIVYLAVTLAPFVVIGPLVGPLIDRFGGARRFVAALTCLGRGILCLFIAGDLRNLLLYPEAFGVLVLDKAYSVTKSALVPSLVSDDADLVEANSRLSRISTVASLLGGALAAGILSLSDATPVLRVASLVYFTAAVLALQITPQDPARLPAAALERQELHSPTIHLAASAMTLLRGTVGFVTFLVAFGLKRAGQPIWFFGAVAAAGVLGGLTGTLAAPLLRRRLRQEEPLLTAALLITGLVTLGAASYFGRVSETAAVFAVAFAASLGRQGFDSILQRDAPDAAHGRSFARFETLFQLVWVVGALLAVGLEPSARSGLVALGAVAAAATLAWITPRRRQHRQRETE